MSYLSDKGKKVSSVSFGEMKSTGEKIAMMTAYDFTMASLLDEAGIDSLLVGDSASNVMCGNSTTIPITLDEMIYHARSVVRGAKRALVVCDMPFGSYQVSCEEAVRNAVRIMKESGAEAIKLEGGIEMVDRVKAIVSAGIPVVGHLGLTPQSVHRFGGYSLRGQSVEESNKLLSDSKALDDAGIFALVLEKIPATLAKQITDNISAATIGIGAGNGTDGQVLVSTDALGFNKDFNPKFLRKFADVRGCIINGVNNYVYNVRSGSFPSKEESYGNI